MPNPTQRKLLNEPTLKLSELKDLVDEGDRCRYLYDDAVDKWGHYFQSPVNKVARTSKLAFEFDRQGAFQDRGTNLANAEQTLFSWLEKEEHTSVNEWLNLGKPLSSEQVHLASRRLFGGDQKLTNDSLYNQPICRLVHRNQLRRDLDYQVIYQLTPGQSRLIHPNDDGPHEARSLQSVMQNLRRNQRVYWGISETLQSLLAMFDSDLGSRKGSKLGKERFTKELIRISTAEEPGSSLAPDELNESSPLRFWAPPPAFAGSVFHMLFWRSVITGRDLFDRPVTAGMSDSADPQDRAEQYYVIINLFNAAKFRLADYAKLFKALMAIAQTAKTAKIAASGASARDETPLCDLMDVDLSKPPSGEYLLPRYFRDSPVQFPQLRELGLTLPFGSVDKRTFELAWEHHGKDPKNRPVQFSDLLKFLRDKALELILWSKYQMEIRSVGLIPIQYLYHVELSGEDNGLLAELSDKSKQLDDARQTNPAAVKDLEEKINEKFGAIETGQIDQWVTLKRVYRGTDRCIFDHNEWQQIDRLKSPRIEGVQD